MENFVLYEEVGKGESATVYKGRRKGTINFVAIHCIDKKKRAQITNLVRLTHEVSHENIVRFHEWYETSNHLWLVVELCTGGNLETVIAQDDHLPESCIQRFGADIIKGLHHIHSLGIVFSDIRPSKLLLDGPGVLKFSGFGLSRVEGENLAELFQQFNDMAGDEWRHPEENPHNNTMGSLTYMAPEVVRTGEYVMASDLWSLGCLFFHMFTGHPPFLAETEQDLREKIATQETPALRVKGTRVKAQASPTFLNLVQGLLKKHPLERLGWQDLVTHPFWEGALSSLAVELENPPEEINTLRQSIRQSVLSTVRASTQSETLNTNSVLGQVHHLDVETDRPSNEEDTMDPTQFGNESLRPRNDDTNVAFTLGSRPFTAQTPVPDELAQSPLDARAALHGGGGHTARGGGGTARPTPRSAQSAHNRADRVAHREEAAELIFHSSDFVVSPIVDNPKIQKPGSLRYDAKSLPLPALTSEKLAQLSAKDRDKHVAALAESLNAAEKGPPSQKKLHLLNYTANLASSSGVCNELVRLHVLNALAKQARDAQHIDVRSRLLRVMGLICFNATDLDESVNMVEVVSVLTELLRDNFRNAKLKLAIVPTLGEVLHYIASQEERRGSCAENWSVNQMTYTLIVRCLREGEEPVLNHYAAKVIENVATTSSSHAQKFATNEIGLLLWYVFSHATGDALRITALSALVRLTKNSVGVFQSVIEKVGLTRMLATMALPISRTQQAVVTAFASLVTSDARLSRLLENKDFVLAVMKLLESTSPVVRGKAFLVVLEIVKNSHDMLLLCCQSRLVMYIERDTRKQTLSKSSDAQHMEYISRCLDLLVVNLTNAVPVISRDILSALEAVSGRKHPSTVQIKQLKLVLPLLPVLLHFASSPVFRPRVVSEQFLQDLGSFLQHVKSVDSGSVQIQGATGPGGVEEFENTVFALVEAIAQHPAIMLDHCALVIDLLLRALAALVSGGQGEVRAHALRLFSEMAVVFLDEAQFDANRHRAESQKLQHIIAEALLPQYEQLLLEQDPLPSYGLKLLLALLEQNSSFIKQFEKLGLIPVLFQVLADHRSNPVSTTMQHVAGILSVLTSRKETNMRELYDNGLVETLATLFGDVAGICMNSEENADMKGPMNMLLTLLETLHSVLKHVSDVVRKALQTKRGGGDNTSREAEGAEQLLLANKAFTDDMSLITQLLIHEDSDIADLALKCQSLLVQLFGGEHNHAMAQENMECYSLALKQADAKKQKILLRIIKRLLSTEKVHCDMMRLHGAGLADTIQSLCHTASSHADVAVTTLAAEILRLTGFIT